MSVPGKYSWSLLEGLFLIPLCNWTGSCVILGVGPLLSANVQTKSGFLVGGYCAFHLATIILLCRKHFFFAWKLLVGELPVVFSTTKIPA